MKKSKFWTSSTTMPDLHFLHIPILLFFQLYSRQNYFISMETLFDRISKFSQNKMLMFTRVFRIYSHAIFKQIYSYIYLRRWNVPEIGRGLTRKLFSVGYRRLYFTKPDIFFEFCALFTLQVLSLFWPDKPYVRRAR